MQFSTFIAASLLVMTSVLAVAVSGPEPIVFEDVVLKRGGASTSSSDTEDSFIINKRDTIKLRIRNIDGTLSCCNGAAASPWGCSQAGCYVIGPA